MREGWLNLLLLTLLALPNAACTARAPAGKPTGPLPSARSDARLPAVGSAQGTSAFPILPGGYRRIADASVRGYTLERRGDVSLAECANACTNHDEFVCKSFDYYDRQRICELSPHTAAEVAGYGHDPFGPVVSHYQRLVSDPR